MASSQFKLVTGALDGSLSNTLLIDRHIFLDRFHSVQLDLINGPALRFRYMGGSRPTYETYRRRQIFKKKWESHLS